jgi:hypothetical protein
MNYRNTTIDSILIPLVNTTKALPGWSFNVVSNNEGDERDFELQISVMFTDSYHNERERFVIHCFLVPNASYDYRAWRWWLFQQCMLVQQHELCEFFRQVQVHPDDGIPLAGDGFKPFRPNHAAGRNPYQVLEVGTEEDAQAAPGSIQMTDTPPNLDAPKVYLTYVVIPQTQQLKDYDERQ